MKRLILIRHGKSSWKYDVQDHDRPLKKRAFKDADLVINAFKQKLPEGKLEMWSSSAKRALESAKLFKEQLHISDKDFLVQEDLYTFDASQLANLIRSCDDAIDDLIVFGHNPAITTLANQLGHVSFDNVPTTGLVALELEQDSWNEIANGKTQFYLFPKNLR